MSDDVIADALELEAGRYLAAGDVASAAEVRSAAARYRDTEAGAQRAADEAAIEAEYARDVEDAVQAAAEDDVTYAATGEVVLLRDPYEILAEHDGQASTAPSAAGPVLSRAQVADALWEGRMSPREAGVLFPDVLDAARMIGIDLDSRVNLDDFADDAGHATDALEDAADEAGWGS